MSRRRRARVAPTPAVPAVSAAPLRPALAVALLAGLALAGCRSPAADAEATSLLGKPLRAMTMWDATRAELEQQLVEARADLAVRPDDVAAIVWVGRRLAYLGRFRDAVDVYTEGLIAHPDEPHLLRHRGHRWITLRDLDRAVDDLSRADALVRELPPEVEPDGQPNPRGVPLTTLQGNVLYHLGLAHYLRGDYGAALPVWRRARDAAHNDDALCSSTYWLYHTLRRLHRDAEARALLAEIRPDMDVVENHDYHRLLLAFAAGRDPRPLLDAVPDTPEASVSLATIGYGVANWLLCEGDAAGAADAAARVLDGAAWPAFGHIAAEADVARGAIARRAR